MNNSSKQAKLLEKTRQMAALDAVKSSMPISAGMSAVHSSALQSDLAKRFNLPGAVVPRTNNNQSKKQVTSTKPTVSARKSSAESRGTSFIVCQSCDFENASTSTVCECCGFYLSSARQHDTTLAQRLGVSAAPAAVRVLSLTDWETVEEQAAARNESHCPICMVGFNQGSEVLLSCSHIFHRACIASFERFTDNSNSKKSKERSCPICRCMDYQKRLTHKGSKAYQIVCAIKLQALFRGHQCRKVFRSKLRQFYRRSSNNNNSSINNNNGTSQRRKLFYEQELTTYASEMENDVNRRGLEVNSFMRSVSELLILLSFFPNINSKCIQFVGSYSARIAATGCCLRCGRQPATGVERLFTHRW